jgi:hypothetical protein
MLVRVYVRLCCARTFRRAEQKIRFRTEISFPCDFESFVRNIYFAARFKIIRTSHQTAHNSQSLKIMKTSDASWATCPLTRQPFIEPVIDYEGNTYEKEVSDD